jgi:hypothetical protein
VHDRKTQKRESLLKMIAETVMEIPQGSQKSDDDRIEVLPAPKCHRKAYAERTYHNEGYRPGR